MSKHRAVHARSIRVSWVAAGASLVTAMALGVIVAEPAFATTVTANDAAHLAADLADNTNDTVVLGASITISDGSNLTVSATKPKTLDLNGQTLTVNSVGANLAALDVSGSASLTVVDSGSGGQLTVTGGAGGAGIGSGNGADAGTVAISGVPVVANGGTDAAGIGGGSGHSGLNVTISSGATVNAHGSGGGAGIGGGKSGGGAVAITNATVAATGGSGGGAGIGGGGNGGGAGAISITNAIVNGTGGTDGAGIGTGQGGSPSGASVAISGNSNVIGSGSGGGAGIGGGSGAAGFGVTIAGGQTSAIGGSGGGAGIGGGNGGAGSNLTISGITQVTPPSTGADITANGGGGGAGIGGGSGGNGGGTVSMIGSVAPDPNHPGNTIIVGMVVHATGGSGGGAGVGGGNGGNGGTVSVAGGSLSGTGAGGGAGLGGGNNGSGGTVSTSSGGGIVAQDGGGTSSAVGAGSGGASFGSLTNNAGLTIPAGSTLRIPSGATADNPGTVINGGTITGAGTLSNTGTILNSGTIDNNGDGGAGHLTVSIHNFNVTYDIGAGTGTTPAAQRVYAASLSVAGLSLPAPGAGTFQPPAGASFYAWYSASNAVVSTLTDLAGTFGNGPRTVPLHAHYRLPQTITFNPSSLPTQTFGSNPVPLTVSATSGLPVTVNAGPSNVCTYDGSAVTIVGAGACGISASQGGNVADWQPAPNASISFSVITGTLVIPVVGTQTYAGYPTFTTAPGFNPPNGVTLQGSISCTALTSGSITSTLAPGSYQIDSNSCGGAGLDGTNSPNYHIAYSAAPGSFTVNPAQITVSALGVQPFGGTPTFMPAATLPPNVQLTGTLTCTALESGPISPSLPIGSGYTTKASTCSGLGLTGAEAFGYTIVYADGQFVVSPAPVTVTATGTQAFGASPTFTPVSSPPSGVTVNGTLTCTGLTGNIPITPSLSVGGHFTIDHATCGGMSLSGPNAGNYVVAYADGPFTVTKAHVAIDTHTNSFTNQNSVHKVIWTSHVTNSDAHTILSGIQVTITVKVGTTTITCKATTDNTGTATCSSGLGSLFLPPRNRTYTATTAETSVLFAGSATGTIGS